MIRNKQSARAFVSFLVTWSFLVLTVTGLVLYVVPHGRISRWLDWSLMGLGTEAWQDVHILFGGVFIVAGILHLYLNWKPFKNYIAQKAKGHFQVKYEVLASLAVTLLLAVGAVLHVPPINWVFDISEVIKESWARPAGHEPPFGRAEESSLADLAQRGYLDLPSAQATLDSVGIQVDDGRDSLLEIARANRTSPAAVYALISQRAHSDTPGADAPTPLDPAELEQRLTGTNMGGKTIRAFAIEQGVDPKTALERLSAIGLQAGPEDRLKVIAEAAGTRPVEIAKAILIDGYRPEGL